VTLQNKVALVTGIDSAIGLAIARRFVAEGAQVGGCRVETSRPRVNPADIPPQAVGLDGDVSLLADATRMVETLADRFGRLDVLVNFGAARRIIGTVMDVTDTEFEEEMKADLRCVMVLSSAAIPVMAKGGGGAILNISSIAAAGLKGRALRSSSKAALAALTRAMAQDHGADNVRVNALLLGPIQEGPVAPRADQPGIPFREGALRHIPTPDDVAAAAHFLVSDEARSITGALLPVDGGRSLPTF
jgi:NAD(P)-dependent dehydrogenase (short-subunit alcohol dehydrogenase family)